MVKIFHKTGFSGTYFPVQGQNLRLNDVFKVRIKCLMWSIFHLIIFAKLSQTESQSES